MRPIVQPHLVNDPFGDPGLYVDFLFGRRAILFDLGELAPLPARKLLRVSHAFVSHAHMDHFAGFDRLLRLFLGRGKRLALAGPAGFIDRVEHKLAGYTWNLVHSYAENLVFEVSEFPSGRAARFESRTAFRREALDPTETPALPFRDRQIAVRAAILDHDTPCLAYVLDETRHVNIWKSRLDAAGLPVGPWLAALKEAVLDDAPDDTPIRIRPVGDDGDGRTLPLGALKASVLSIEPGARIGYVVDAIGSDENVRRIVDLVRGADVLFIETPFLDEDRDIARERHHLTARQAGEIARRAEVKRMVPFHFSPRYSTRPDAIRAEAETAFRGPSGS